MQRRRPFSVSAARVALRLFAALLEARFFFFAIDLLHLHDERHFALRQANDRLLCADAEEAFTLGLDGFDLDFVDGHAHFIQADKDCLVNAVTRKLHTPHFSLTSVTENFCFANERLISSVVPSEKILLNVQ